MLRRTLAPFVAAALLLAAPAYAQTTKTFGQLPITTDSGATLGANYTVPIWDTVHGQTKQIALSNFLDPTLIFGALSASGPLPMGYYWTTLPTLTNGAYSALQLDASGRLITAAQNPATPSYFVNQNENFTSGALNVHNDGSFTGGGGAGAPLTGGASGITTAANQAIAIAAYNGATLDALQVDGSKNLKTTLATALPAGANVIGAVTQASAPWTTYSPNGFVRLSANFTRPANTTAYAAGKLVANSTTAGSVTPLAFTSATRAAGDAIRIERVRILTSSNSLTTASFIVHFFEASPTVSVGDGTAFDSSGTLSTTGSANYVGPVPVTLTMAGSDGANGVGTPAVGTGITLQPSTTTFYALIEANSAYTPTSGETITVVVEGYRS